MEDAIDNCNGCDDDWIAKRTVDSWYPIFKEWVANGNCGSGLENNYVKSSEFYECLSNWESTAEGELYSSRLAWEDKKLIGSDISVEMVKLDTADEKI